MAIIRHLRIERFRGIHALSWQPFAGVNCFIDGRFRQIHYP